MPFPSGEPPWQTADLTSLATAGKLSGVNPVILGAIAQEESGYEVAGAGFNPAGYGGYFGLGLGKYPAGSIPKSELLTNSDQSFQDQSIVAASAFASYMQQAASEGYKGNDVVDRAETIFQQGGGYKGIESGGGRSLVDSALGNASGGNPSPASGGTSGTAQGTTTTPKTFDPKAGDYKDLVGVGAVLQELDQLLNPPSVGGVAGFFGVGNIPGTIEALVIRGIFAIAFLGVAYIGVKQITGGGGGGSTVIDLVQQNAKNDLAQQRIDAANAETARKANPAVIRRESTINKNTVMTHNRTGGYNNNSTINHVSPPKPTRVKPTTPTIAKEALEVL